MAKEDVMSILNFLTKEQIEEEEELKFQLGTMREERANIIRFHEGDVVDGGDMDRKWEGLQKVTISLRGKEKYISIFDLDIGLRFYLEDNDVERLLNDKFLHLTFKVPIPEKDE
jgi:hypothetical protein